ncbi:MAG: hypothetical protein ACREBS_10885 [Nitrososphaerales archaeon]
MSQDIGVPFRVLDIDKPDQAKVGDGLVKKYGDDCEDYLVPQVFLEYPDGKVQHIFTGFSENTSVTKKHWADLFSSQLYESLKKKERQLGFL